MSISVPTILLTFLLMMPAPSQTIIRTIPKEARTARTVAIINKTHVDAVQQGALEAIKRWGRLTVVDDADSADLVLTFEKNTDRTGTSTTKSEPDGHTGIAYSIRLDSWIHMKSNVKGADMPFFTTTTGESKKKAGNTCVTDLQAALNYSH